METNKYASPCPRFNEWWTVEYYRPNLENPCERGSAAFWAWEGWQAALHYNLLKVVDEK